MKVREAIKRLRDEGWEQVRKESSHRTFKKADVKEIVTVSGVDGKEISTGQLRDIQRKAGWK